MESGSKVSSRVISSALHSTLSQREEEEDEGVLVEKVVGTEEEEDMEEEEVEEEGMEGGSNKEGDAGRVGRAEAAVTVEDDASRDRQIFYKTKKA